MNEQVLGYAAHLLYRFLVHGQRSAIGQLVGSSDDVIPFVGSLYSLHYPEVENVSPEFWRSRLQEEIQAVFSALAKRAPTVFFLEDLHWADPSFIALLRVL
jgi:predicted ATPase